MRYAFILNPTAGHGLAGRKRRVLEAALAEAGLQVDVRTTGAPGHAVALARTAAAETDAVVAVGGDGTVHEVCRGIVQSGRDVPLGVIPLGTGNDFIKMLGIPRAPRAAVAALQLAARRRIDYGRVVWHEADRRREAVFVNAVGMGFDAQVADTVDGLKFIPGTAAYVAAALRTLRVWDSPDVTVTMEKLNGEAQRAYHGSMLLITSGNGTCSGGGFYLTPGASVKDGTLEVCLVEHASPGRILTLLPLALFGRHVNAPEAHMYRAQRIRLESSAPLPLHADGEILSRAAYRMDVEIVPGGLSVLAPGEVR